MNRVFLLLFTLGAMSACGGEKPATDTSVEADTDTDVDTDTDTDADTDSDTEIDHGTPEEWVLSTTPQAACVALQGIFPLPNEGGHWAAASMLADQDVSVDEIGYTLTKNPSCDNGLAHAVEVFVSSTPTPSPSPSTQDGYQRQAVPGRPHEDRLRDVLVSLDPPVQVPAGQYLVVSIEMVVDGQDTTCLGACMDEGGTIGVGFWSNSASEPYPWADMVADFGFNSDFYVWALGESS